MSAVGESKSQVLLFDCQLIPNDFQGKVIANFIPGEVIEGVNLGSS